MRLSLKNTGHQLKAKQADSIAQALHRASNRSPRVCSLALLGVLWLGSLTSLDAHALALGSLKALSSIGEPLRAEVELLDLTAAEVSSLRASLVTPETYKAMGLDYNPELNSMQFILQRSPSGRAVIQLINSKTVTTAFVDIVLELSWANGKITRDFTLLLTPPNAGMAAAPVTPLHPIVSPHVERAEPALARTSAPTPHDSMGTKPVERALPASTTTKAETPSSPRAVLQAQSPVSPAPSISAASAKRVDVVRGDTASKLVVQSLPNNVSLAQMLLALLRGNSDAFMADNVNRLKAGASLALPTVDDSLTVPRTVAHQAIIFQSRDFDVYRQQLASRARTDQVPASGRDASGQKQGTAERTAAKVEEDKLTLSNGVLKGAPVGTISTEEKLARELQAKDETSRLAELSKNIGDLNKLVVDPATTALPTHSALKEGSTGVLSLAALRAQNDLNNLIDRLSMHPAIMPATAGFLGFSLAGIFFRSRRNSAGNSSDLRSTAQGEDRTKKTLKESVTSSNNNLFPNSTKAAPTSSAEALIQTTERQHQADRLEPFAKDPLGSMQGEQARGQQAEALLRSALKRVPQPLALHIELMDLYIARKDTANFQNLAIEALTITGGYGFNWERICQKGHSIDPQNLLYQLTAVNPMPQTAA